MTKKHYLAFATMFRRMKPKDEPQLFMWGAIVVRTALLFKEDNPKFDMNKFVAAVTVE